MNLFNIMGLVSTVALALPIITTFNLKARLVQKFSCIFFYYLLVLKLYALLFLDI